MRRIVIILLMLVPLTVSGQEISNGPLFMKDMLNGKEFFDPWGLGADFFTMEQDYKIKNLQFDLPGVDVDQFNPYAKRAALWTRDALNRESRDFLLNLPRIPIRPLIDKSILLTHASPRQPVWEYIDSPEVALANFREYSEELCLFGHSHVQMMSIWQPIPNGFHDYEYVAVDRSRNAMVGLLHPPDPGVLLPLNFNPTFRMMLNPGSVGQPRDKDPRSAYAILDVDAMTWECDRVEYRIAETQQQMKKAHLPIELIERLSFGY